MDHSYLNYWKKRRIPMKKKFIAAVSLVLVSFLLLTSVSYAWLVLSTRPDLTGVETVVGANGNLEIALATKDHLDQLSSTNMYEENTPLVLTTNDPYQDNVLWGNIIDLQDPRYGLNQVVLRPSSLNILNQTLQVTNPLITMQYGNDGRIMYEDTFSAVSGYDPNSQSFLTSNANAYGVRVAGIPYNAALMTRLQKLSAVTQQSATQVLNRFTTMLMDIFYTESSSYSTADIQTLLDAVTVLHSQYEQAVTAVGQAFTGAAEGTDEAALLQEIQEDFDDAAFQLYKTGTLLRKYGGAEGDPTAEPVTLTQSQAKEILSPLFGDVIYYSKEPNENGTGFQWVYHADKSLNGNELKAELGEGSYFQILGVFSGEYTANGSYTPGNAQGSYATKTAEWTATIQDYSQIFRLEGESMASKYMGYLAEFDAYASQRETFVQKLSRLIQQEHNAELQFFYEYTLHPLPDPETGLPDETTQPFTPGELKVYLNGIDDRINELEDIIPFLENYAKAAILVYASSGALDRQTYVAVIAENQKDASVRTLLETAGLTGNPNFTAIMEACESARQTIATWREATAELDAELNPRDDSGHIISSKVRDMTVADLLGVWDIIEDISNMTVAGYGLDDFTENANKALVQRISALYPGSYGLFGSLALLQKPAWYSDSVTLSDTTYRKDSDTQYLTGHTVSIATGTDEYDYKLYPYASRLEAARNIIRDQFPDTEQSELWAAQYARVNNAIQTLNSLLITDAGSQVIADAITERVISGEITGYNRLYYSQLESLISDTEIILQNLEDVLANQILLYAAGLTTLEESAEESQALYETALENWENGTWSLQKLQEEISYSGSGAFDTALMWYQNNLQLHAQAKAAFSTLSVGSLTWNAIASVLELYIGKDPTSIVTYNAFRSNTHAGAFGDFQIVLNNLEDEDSSSSRYYTYRGLPDDIDRKYRIGITSVETRLESHMGLELEQHLYPIAYLIDRTEDAQKHTVSDREFVFNNAARQMNSASARAQRYYLEYAKREHALLKLANRCALSYYDFTLEESDSDEPVYPMSDISAARTALLQLNQAIDSAMECVQYALRASAASAATSESVYESTIHLESIEALLEALNLHAGNAVFDLYTDLSVLSEDITDAISALDRLLASSEYWGETANDANIENYLIQQVFSILIPIQNLKINGMSAAYFLNQITDLEAPYIPEDGSPSQMSVASMIIANFGIHFTAEDTAITTAHNLFETATSICVSSRGSNVIFESERLSFALPSHFQIACTHDGDLDNSVSLVYACGAPGDTSASGLNSSSNYLIADTYAIAIDFLLRTNAAVSNLLLQTDGIQRVYSEEVMQDNSRFNAEIMEEMEGNGSYIQLINDDPQDEAAWKVIDNPEATPESLQKAKTQLGGSMLKSIQIVFADTVTGEIYGRAVPWSISYDSEDRSITGTLRLVDQKGNVKEDAILKEMVQNQVSAITAWIYLDGTRVDNFTVESELLSKLVMNLQFATDAELVAAQQSVALPEETTG